MHVADGTTSELQSVAHAGADDAGIGAAHNIIIYTFLCVYGIAVS